MIIKTPAQIVLIKKACKIVSEALKIAEKLCVENNTTMFVNDEIEKYILSEGATPSFKNYNGFPFSICASKNEQVVHGFPNDIPLKAGDIISIDIGARFKGFHGDAARTFAIGEVSPQKKHLIEVTKQSFFEGIKHLKVGDKLGKMSSAIQKFVESHNMSVVRELVGHGIGAELHEDPQIPNYGKVDDGDVLVGNVCLAIEPMVNLGRKEVQMLQDGWTIITRDRKPSAHYENTVLLTNEGVEILTL